MIDHRTKVIYIHIPKCAGTSIEEYFCSRTMDWSIPNYKNLIGWCPRRKIHLQHASCWQLLELELVTEEQWSSYSKFAVIRNPWDRALSSYLWLRKFGFTDLPFIRFIRREKPYCNLLENPENPDYRGEHFASQNSFLFVEKSIAVDKVIRFENLKTCLTEYFTELGLKKPFDVHANKTAREYPHYSQFYDEDSIKLLTETYREDIKTWGYWFERLPESSATTDRQSP